MLAPNSACQRPGASFVYLFSVSRLIPYMKLGQTITLALTICATAGICLLLAKSVPLVSGESIGFLLIVAGSWYWSLLAVA